MLFGGWALWPVDRFECCICTVVRVRVRAFWLKFCFFLWISMMDVEAFGDVRFGGFVWWCLALGGFSGSDVLRLRGGLWVMKVKGEKG